MSAPSPSPGGGFVALVGAGPGDPELLTLRAVRHLGRADVVLHDALVDPGCLAHCRANVRVLPVGKRAAGVRTPQALIHRLLLVHARAGRYVVRLKGGDPLVFGRGGEEAAFLAAQGVPFEIVPGVSSALAAPAAAGIPVTHRGVSRGVLLATGTSARRPGRGAPADDAEAQLWARHLRRGGTVVVLMALRHLEALRARLLAAGASPATPAALVERATLPSSRTVRAPLGDLAERARVAGVEPPALLVLGRTAAMDLRCPLQDPARAPHDPGAPRALAGPPSPLPPPSVPRDKELYRASR